MTEARTTYVGKVALLVVASLFASLMWAFASATPAEAQTEPYSTQTPDVLPTRITDDDRETRNPDDSDDQVGAVDTGERPNSGVLPFTGGDVILFVVIGAAAVAAGAVLVRRARTNN